MKNPSNQRRQQPRRTGGAISSAEKANLHRLYVDWIVLDYMPFCMGSSSYFLLLIEALNPAYMVPSRSRLSKHLVQARGAGVTAKVAEDMEGATFVSITTDGWTSITMDNLITITAHIISLNWELKYA